MEHHKGQSQRLGANWEELVTVRESLHSLVQVPMQSAATSDSSLLIFAQEAQSGKRKLKSTAKWTRRGSGGEGKKSDGVCGLFTNRRVGGPLVT